MIGAPIFVLNAIPILLFAAVHGFFSVFPVRFSIEIAFRFYGIPIFMIGAMLVVEAICLSPIVVDEKVGVPDRFVKEIGFYTMAAAMITWVVVVALYYLKVEYWVYTYGSLFFGVWSASEATIAASAASYPVDPLFPKLLRISIWIRVVSFALLAIYFCVTPFLPYLPAQEAFFLATAVSFGCLAVIFTMLPMLTRSK